MGYNTANQISQIAEPSQTRNFGYDNVDRLTSMTNGTSNESYNFDGVGNRTSSHLSATYNYQPFNRVTATVSANYNYDANGNMTTKAQGKELWRYAWDYENRLVSASTRKQTVRYKYDALGRRIQRYFVGGRENTKFIYDGLDVLMDDNSGVLTKYQNGLGIDNKLKLSTNGVSKYFLSDHLGSTNALTDSSGNILESTNYDSFGNATNQLSTRYAYTGREFDSFTGLHYYRARFYDAQLGRFISEDPIGFAGGDVNLFGYVKNNSLRFRDPLGLQKCNPYVGGLLTGVVGGSAGALAGGEIGTATGLVIGGLGGTLVAPGLGTLGGGLAGGAVGGTVGAVVGGVTGAGIGFYMGYIYCNEDATDTPCDSKPKPTQLGCRFAQDHSSAVGKPADADGPADYTPSWCRYICANGVTKYFPAVGGFCDGKPK